MQQSPAKKLLLSLKRGQKNPSVPIGPYDDSSIRALSAECKSLYATMMELMEDGEADVDELPDGVKATLVVNQQKLLRNKQVALTYLQTRLAALCQLRLDAGLVLPDEIRRNLSPQEATFFAEYDDVLADFMRDIRIDLTSHQRPPKHLFIEVRALVDCGELVTEYSGVVNLAKGTSHFLLASDVQHLINQGALEHVL